MRQKKPGHNRQLRDLLVAQPRPLRSLPTLYRGEPHTPDQFREDMVFALAAFRLTQHGAFMWRAYASARKSGRPVPDGVLEYLDACAYAVSFCQSDAQITARMLLRHSRGGAQPGRRLKDASRQVDILQSLMHEYHKVRLGQVVSKVQARRNVAAQFQTTEGRVHQLEIKAGL